MTAQTLEQWNEQYGTDTFAESTRPKGFEFDIGVAYPVSVKAAKICTSQRGSRQVELTLNILKGEDVAGQTKVWLELPKQPVVDPTLAPDKMRTRVLRRRDDLLAVYGSADPKRFAVYKERIKNDHGRYDYVGHDGERLTSDAFKAREREVNQNMMDYGDELHGYEDGHTLEELTDTFFYLSKAERKDKPEYPWTNVYTLRPEKLPLFGE